MKIEYLLDLLESGQYVQCIAHLDELLSHQPDNNPTRLLRGKCLLKISTATCDRSEEAYRDFMQVLDMEPTNVEALHHGIQTALFAIKKYSTEVIQLCNGWLRWAVPVQQIEVLKYRAQAHLLAKDFQQALIDCDKVIAIAKLAHAADRSQLDLILSDAYLTKANIALYEMQDSKLALDYFKRGFDYPYADATLYAEISKLAFQLEAYEFGGAAAIRFFSITEKVPGDKLLELYQVIDALIAGGAIHKNLIHAKLVACKIFGGLVELNPLDNLNFIRKFTKIYPDWKVLYHFYGAELFDAEGYAEALPYIQKSMALGGTAFDVYRYLEASYRVNQQMPRIEKLPLDDARNFYFAARALQNTALQLKNQHNAAWFFQHITLLYEQAFDIFYAYFFRQIGSSINNDRPLFAKCCHHYGLVLVELKRYEEADKIYSTGYAIFPFVELLDHWSEVLLYLDRYDEVIIKVRQVLAQQRGRSTFADDLRLHSREVIALFQLGELDECKTKLALIEQGCQQLMVSEELSKEAKLTLFERYADLQHVRSFLLETQAASHVISVWQQQLEKNPDDDLAWLMLMQQYHETNYDEQCIACANNCLALKQGALKPKIALQVYYQRGIAFANINRHERALSDLNFVFKLHCEQTPLNNFDFLRLCGKLAFCYRALGNWISCLGYTQVVMDLFSPTHQKMEGVYSDVLLLNADSNYALGNIKEAQIALYEILFHQPENAAALHRKQIWKKAGFFSFWKRGVYVSERC